MGCGASLVATTTTTVDSSGQADGQVVRPSLPQPTPPVTRSVITQTPPIQPKLAQNKSSNAKSNSERTKSKSSLNQSKTVSSTEGKNTQEKTAKIDSIVKTKEEESKTIETQDKMSKTMSKEKVDESYLPLEPESQRKFDTVLKSSCLLVKPDSVMKAVDKNVTKLQLNQALPHTYSIYRLVSSLENLQVLDLSNNNLGPQGFRSVCLAMCCNTSIFSLNLAGNMSDTDSADCVGRMLSQNRSLLYLDVSSNSLGKDYFSRCVGPALKTNNTLQTLRAQSIGSTDMKVLLENLTDNSTLTEIDLSSNSLSDRSSLGKAFSTWIQTPGCRLESLSLSSCDMNPESLSLLCDSLKNSSSLTELNLNGNEFGSLNLVLRFIAGACCQGRIQNLHMNDGRVKDQSVTQQDLPEYPSTPPCLQVLSLNSSNISNSLFSELKKWCKGRQLPLTDLDTSNNSALTTDCLDDIISVTTGESGTSSLQRLTFGLNDAETLSQKLNMSCLPSLTYLNLRKAKLTAPAVTAVVDACLSQDTSLTTLVLDGLKLAGTDTMKQLGANIKGSKLTTLSLGGCSLAESDLSSLCDLIKQGHPLHMLKLSANRITDIGVEGVAQALVSQKTHPLGVLDLSNNTIGDAGATSLSQLYSNKSHKSSLHSLNLAGNNIGKIGVSSLVSVVGSKFPLKTLYLNNQRDAISEVEMDEVYSQLAKSLGFKVGKIDEIPAGSSDLPSLPEGLLINLSKLGGQPGSLGRMLHSRAIVTDTTQDLLTGLTLSAVFEIVAGLQRLGSDCVLSSEVWNLITGANKDREVPSWLQLLDHRERAVYLCNLPGNASVQKLEGMLEMEADCSVDEVVLMKDPVTRSNNGVAWVLLSNTESVKKAIDFYLQGEAKVFGQPFSISRVLVKVDDEKNSELEAKARKDMESRTRARRSADAAHRALIQQNTEESWKRHAYRLAHPAYADGRVW